MRYSLLVRIESPRLSSDSSKDIPVVVACVIYAGTDVDNFYVGIPIPGGGGKAFAFYQSVTERGRASLFLSFQDADGKPIATTEPTVGDAHYKDLYFLTFIGPFALTDLEIETRARLTEIGADTLRQADDSVRAAGDQILPDKDEEEENDDDQN